MQAGQLASEGDGRIGRFRVIRPLGFNVVGNAWAKSGTAAAATFEDDDQSVDFAMETSRGDSGEDTAMGQIRAGFLATQDADAMVKAISMSLQGLLSAVGGGGGIALSDKGGLGERSGVNDQLRARSSANRSKRGAQGIDAGGSRERAAHVDTALATATDDDRGGSARPRRPSRLWPW